MKKHYLIYQITNLINGKIYIGKHETFNINDEYMGSGTLIMRSQKKHGIKNFKKEILFEFKNKVEMDNKETELVNEEFVLRKDVYNLALGGIGGFSKEAQINGSINGQIKLKKLKKDDEWVKIYNKKLSDGAKKFFINGGKGSFTGKTHTEETKKKIGAIVANAQKGKGNSNYGNMWIYNEDLKLCKCITKTTIIEAGWKKVEY